MAVLSRLALTASFALCGVSAAGIQQPLTAPESLPPSHEAVADYGSKPIIDSEALQSAISIDTLVKRAESFYKFAKASEEEYGHPTRVIGSAGKS
jgi:aminopeptidase Y